jgi:hypothetical protein
MFTNAATPPAPMLFIGVGVVIFSLRSTQGGSFLATLGFEAESLWDSWKARLAL